MSRVYVSAYSGFGEQLELSADDGALVVAARGKSVASTTPGGSFPSPGNIGSNSTLAAKGAVWVFIAPEDGWSNATDVTSGKTEIAAQAAAAAWDPANNYSPGPAPSALKAPPPS